MMRGGRAVVATGAHLTCKEKVDLRSQIGRELRPLTLSDTLTSPRRAEVDRSWGRMQTETPSTSSAAFAANRARGAVAFDVHVRDGATRRGRLHESGSLRVRF